MSFFIYLLVGALGGVLGGMGMGGGTLIIPALTIFCEVEQHVAQAINLISFMPMAIVALIIHIKNRLVRFEKVLWIIIPGVLFCVLGCWLSKGLSNTLLSKLFGGFLVLLSLFQFATSMRKKSH